jgi:hypothetical protein
MMEGKSLPFIAVVSVLHSLTQTNDWNSIGQDLEKVGFDMDTLGYSHVQSESVSKHLGNPLEHNVEVTEALEHP